MIVALKFRRSDSTARTVLVPSSMYRRNGVLSIPRISIRHIPNRRIPIVGLGLGIGLGLGSGLEFSDSGYADLEFGDLKFSELKFGEMKRNQHCSGGRSCRSSRRSRSTNYSYT